ncbi:MAG: methyltransferase domain-containing protein [Calditrichaceae bacterium]|nr:methyltransferase domain-containing protein [Calditrichia bacterium]NUQ41003.1 methyltransferase domain-containing protein [Calditrichaceae bacterium]
MSEKLYHNIRQFYDVSSALWEETWGEHMHHGYYGPNGDEKRDHRRAQVDLIEELLRWGEVRGAEHILDLGCGIGGSSLYLAQKFNARVAGITLSPVQANRARERAAAAGLSGRAQFAVADALHPPFGPGAFDLAWSLESGEHMPEKRRFLQAGMEMLRPGGKFLMAAWCRRALPPALSFSEQRLLRRLCRVYHLPPLVSIEEYQNFAAEAGFTDLRTADWTRAVSPFWKAVARSALSFKSVRGLIRAGWPTIRGALAMNLMIRGYRSGLVRFGLLQGVKRMEHSA